MFPSHSNPDCNIPYQIDLTIDRGLGLGVEILAHLRYVARRGSHFFPGEEKRWNCCEERKEWMERSSDSSQLLLLDRKQRRKQMHAPAFRTFLSWTHWTPQSNRFQQTAALCTYNFTQRLLVRFTQPFAVTGSIPWSDPHRSSDTASLTWLLQKHGRYTVGKRLILEAGMFFLSAVL